MYNYLKLFNLSNTSIPQYYSKAILILSLFDIFQDNLFDQVDLRYMLLLDLIKESIRIHKNSH
ncbi:hypothetical protein pb186bvf_005072 [Paramecium bursaria]